jgi:hypothetical protein
MARLRLKVPVLPARTLAPPAAEAAVDAAAVAVVVGLRQLRLDRLSALQTESPT